MWQRYIGTKDTPKKVLNCESSIASDEYRHRSIYQLRIHQRLKIQNRITKNSRKSDWVEESNTWKPRVHSRPTMKMKDKSQNHRAAMALLLSLSLRVFSFSVFLFCSRFTALVENFQLSSTVQCPGEQYFYFWKGNRHLPDPILTMGP
jgi:hypothetical protein